MGVPRKIRALPRVRHLRLLALLLLVVVVAAPAQSKQFPPQVTRGVVLPVGFASRVFAQTPPGLLPTSLVWGPSTAAAAPAGSGRRHGTALYVTTVSGNAFSGTDNGILLSYSDESIPTIAAQGLDQPLGVVMGPDKTLYVSETVNNHGRVTALRDNDGDGVFEERRTVIGNLPNGRHQTNGMVFGPDGMLYVANGSATDDGLECGPALVPGSGEDDCPAPEQQPWSGAVLRVDPAWNDVDLLADVRMDTDGLRAADGMDIDSVLVARGFRNIYDVDFDPLRPNDVWTPMNGPDNPSGSEPLYAFNTANERPVGTQTGPIIEDAGFPSCLYDPHVNAFPQPQIGSHEHPGDPHPQDNPNPQVIGMFGPCTGNNVMLPKAIFAEGHEGTSGATFVRSSNFPARYANDLLVAEWGSLWNLNGGTVSGHKIIHVELDSSRNVVGQREFMSGVLPMDVTFNADGHLFVADMSGQIYDVWHAAEVTADEVTVDMRSGQFVPQVVTVVRGQTVRWVNADTTPHDVRAVSRVAVVDPQGAEPVVQSGTEMDSAAPVPPGESHRFTFTDTGVYTYNSRTSGVEENTMRGTIVVLPADR